MKLCMSFRKPLGLQDASRPPFANDWFIVNYNWFDLNLDRMFLQESFSLAQVNISFSLAVFFYTYVQVLDERHLMIGRDRKLTEHKISQHKALNPQFQIKVCNQD